MFSFVRPKRQTIRNPWTNKQRRHAVPATVLSGLAVLVMTTLLAMAWLLINAVQSPNTNNNELDGPLRNSAIQKPPVVVSQPEPEPQLPQIELKQHLVQHVPPRTHKPPPQQHKDDEKPSNIPLDEDQVGTERPTTIDTFRQAFEARYGPQVSKMLREKALQSFGSVQATADRFLQALREGRPLRLGFAGYSITVGRGNHYHQSYPFVLYHLLAPLLHHNLDLSLEVTNAAIGGIPSFPYGFCLEHFLGAEHLDMVSWDYSMNEQGNTAVLESYIRHAEQAYPDTRPMILALDKHKGRCQLLNSYTQKGLLKDALCVAKASEVIPKSLFENVDEATLPAGLQKWSEFGAPPNCPGRGSWHPKKMEHATIAWTMATYFVDALELAVEQYREQNKNNIGETDELDDDGGPVLFPKPLSPDLPENPAAIQSLLYGHADGASEYRMHAISCRTNFEPAADHENVLTSIVTEGLVPDATVDDILEKRSDEMYTKGWVLDVSQLERETKIKVDKCGGLGYVDMKIAIYGTAESGPLDLWLPVDDSGHEAHDHDVDDTEALHWIESLVICEANEKRPDTACKLTTDLQYTVGGVAVASPVPVLKGAAEYLKRPTCVAVGIPTGARLTQNENGDWGLPVQVKAASHVTREGGACCLSHVVWEHTLHED
eukprot:scaffold2102_cov161-Amphora_coffeaeformis.AAC.33